MNLGSKAPGMPLGAPMPGGFERAPLAPPLTPSLGAGPAGLAEELLAENARRAADLAPVGVENRGGDPQLRLNYARFRDDKILCPGNVDLTSHNEFRTVKRRLLLAMQEAKTVKDRPNSVLVTSAMPGEGKTFTALNLAVVLAAERNMHVLLVDGDAVNPSLSGYFNIDADTPGLTDLLEGSVARAADVVHGCADIANLSVMFAGKSNARAPELMASARLDEVLAELHRTYPDLFVVFDCSPAISPEPAALAPHVDHAIMVVAAQQTSRHQLREALEHLAACPHVSMLFNKSPRWRKDASYYGYYAQAAYGGLGEDPACANLGAP